MSTNERFNMEVRDAEDESKLLGWLLVPLAVYQGEHDSWAFALRHRYGDRNLRHVRLPVASYRTPAGQTWWAFQATPAELQQLREVAVFASAA